MDANSQIVKVHKLIQKLGGGIGQVRRFHPGGRVRNGAGIMEKFQCTEHFTLFVFQKFYGHKITARITSKDGKTQYLVTFFQKPCRSGGQKHISEFVFFVAGLKNLQSSRCLRQKIHASRRPAMWFSFGSARVFSTSAHSNLIFLFSSRVFCVLCSPRASCVLFSSSCGCCALCDSLSF